MLRMSAFGHGRTFAAYDAQPACAGGAGDYGRSEPGTMLSVVPRYKRGQFAKQLGRGVKSSP